MGFYEINDEHKVRITLSEKATIIMHDDMRVFSVSSPATFINTVFSNYYAEAKSSIESYMRQKKLDFDEIFKKVDMDDKVKEMVINELLKNTRGKVENLVNQYKKAKGSSKTYHINRDNRILIGEDCEEGDNYSRAGQYIKCVVEEYCSLPFIERERIYRKEVFEKVERACKEHRILKIRIKEDVEKKEQLFYVYPYKIMPDMLDTRSYLVCYSRKAEDAEKNKKPASFAMSRLAMPSLLEKSDFHLNRQEIASIEERIMKSSPAYLLGEPEKICVRLTEKGKKFYQTRLHSRPNKDEKLSSDNEYVFFCSQQQIYNYFFSFGAEAEIISPEGLRQRFYDTYYNALSHYAENK